MASSSSFVDHDRRDAAPGRALAADLAIRAGGLALLALGGSAIAWLSAPAHAAAGHVATPFDYLAAAAAFLGTSWGGALLWLGAHIHDPVTISERWRPTL